MAHLAAYPLPNEHLGEKIMASISASVGTTMEMDGSRTDLDSHANMCLIGRNSIIVNYSGRYADVNAFSPDIDTLQRIPIVDAAIAYDCPYSSKPYIFLIHNGLYVESMDNNLIPPFIMREAGITVSDVPKIHVCDPTVSDHSIYFEENDLRIPLALWGTFSYFPSRKPTQEDLVDCDYILLTPDGPDWNPHTDVYARNEEQFLDWQGEIIQPKERRKILIEDSDEADVFLSSMEADYSCCSPQENEAIDAICEEATVMATEVLSHESWPVNDAEDLRNVSRLLELSTFVQDLRERCAYSKFGMSIGSMTGSQTDDDNLFISEVASTHAEPSKGVSAKHLAKVWRIDLESVERTLQVTS